MLDKGRAKLAQKNGEYSYNSLTDHQRSMAAGWLSE
jgi:hypothetical protein